MDLSDVIRDQQRGAVQWKKLPKRIVIPRAGIVKTVSQRYYPATGLLEERIEIESLQPGEK
jgi:hypothetical protein